FERLVVITTYRRPDACEELLERLRATIDASLPRPSLRVLVLNDRSELDYARARQTARELFGDDLCWLDARERLGKPGFWRAYQLSFLVAQSLSPEYALYLQDDCSFAPSLLAQARARRQETANDPKRRVLYLFSALDDEAFGRWVISPRKRISARLRRTQWFDL